MSILLMPKGRLRRYSAVSPSARFSEVSIMVNDVLGAGGTITVSGGAGAGTFNTAQTPVNIIAGQSFIRITSTGIQYPIATYNGATGITATGCPNLTAEPFTLSYPKKFWLEVPGSLSGATAPYRSLMCVHGTGGKGNDNLLQMIWNPNFGNVPQSAGYPNDVTGVQWSTTPPFGRDNWKFLTVYPQVATGNTGTAEVEVMFNTIHNYLESNFSIDPLRRYYHGASGGTTIGYSYAAKYASRYAGIVMAAGTPNHFFTNKFSGAAAGGSYTGTTDDDAADFCSGLLAAAGVDTRIFFGDGDPQYTGAYSHMNTAFLNAYAALGISSKYSSTVYAGQDHVTSYTTADQAASTWNNLAATHR